jgi:signal transduction histidine kinase
MDRARALEQVDIQDGLESTLAILKHRFQERQIAVERAIAPSLPGVQGYAGELNQVWTNLLDNAIDAVEPGVGRVTVRAAVEDDAVVVEVRDNGSGIPPEIRDRIWEPFFTTKDVGRGTGLGLDIVRRIVEQHSGQTLVTSSPGDTRFTVRLPLA